MQPPNIMGKTEKRLSEKNLRAGSHTNQLRATFLVFETKKKLVTRFLPISDKDYPSLRCLTNLLNVL